MMTNILSFNVTTKMICNGPVFGVVLRAAYLCPEVTTY
jgi:hypothetical protein